jgi:uncharacterized protein YceK
VVVVALGALLLAGCGSISTTQKAATWAKQSSFASAKTTLTNDARNASRALQTPSLSTNSLHTVCGVLLVDAEAANAALPTPDQQATTLLSKAYNALGDGANTCYRAGNNAHLRQRAVAYLRLGAADLILGSIRLRVAEGLSP